MAIQVVVLVEFNRILWPGRIWQSAAEAADYRKLR
jgi:hypothetical protein